MEGCEFTRLFYAQGCGRFAYATGGDSELRSTLARKELRGDRDGPLLMRGG